MSFRAVFWDLETSGLSFEKGAKVIEIGALIVEPDGTEVEQSWLLKHPGLQLSQEIVDLTGITNELLEAEGRDPAACMAEFLPLFDGRQHVTHNGLRFDVPFLLHTARVTLGLTIHEVAALSADLDREILDTAVMFKARKLREVPRPEESFHSFGKRIMAIRALGLKYNLRACCDWHGIDISDLQQHRALGDVHATRRLFNALVASPGSADES
jgi:DNA polymerase III epsilon subunit-like protein